MSQLIRLGLGRAGTKTIGNAQIDQVLQILFAHFLDETPHRGCGHLLGIIIEHVIAHEQRHLIQIFIGKLETLHDLARQTLTDIFMIIECSLTTDLFVGFGLTDIM